jgi:heat-inducible transcriptional repressor
VLLVLVLQEGVVAQRMWALAQPEMDETLTRVSNQFNDQWIGLTSEQIAAKPLALDSLEAEFRRLVIELMEETHQEAEFEVYRHGLSAVLEAPEFAETKAGRQVVRVLEEHRLWSEISREVMGAGSVHVIIGGEGRWEDLSDCSVVLSRYGWSGQMTGLLGVLGPMRMRYGRAISAVRYVADVLSEMVRNLYVGDEGVMEVNVRR